MDVTNYDAYIALKQWHPSMVANLEASVAAGAQTDEIIEKCKEFTPVAVPNFLWDYIRMAVNHIMAERNGRRGMN